MLFITGPGRCGTSALAGSLKILGLNFGKNLLRAAPENPKGFFEDKVFKAINYDLILKNGGDWDKPPQTIEPIPEIERRMKSFVNKYIPRARITALKDPKLCLTLHLWKRYFDRLDIIYCERQPDEIAESLRRVHGIENGLELIKIYHDRFKAAFDKRKMRLLRVKYTDIISDWMKVIEAINNQFPLLDLAKKDGVNKFIDAKLYRCRGTDGNNTDGMATASTTN